MPLDFVERSERAVFICIFGETTVGYCLESVSKLTGLALVVDGNGVFIHQFYSVLSCWLILVPSSQESLS